MKEKDFIKPDDLFRENWKGFEAPYNEKAWKKMQQLLDQDEREVPMAIIPSKQRNHKINAIIIFMSTLTLLSVLSLFMIKSKSNSISRNESWKHATSHAGAREGDSLITKIKPHSFKNQLGKEENKNGDNENPSAENSVGISQRTNKAITVNSTKNGNKFENTVTYKGNSAVVKNGSNRYFIPLVKKAFKPLYFQRFSTTNWVSQKHLRRNEISYKTFGSGWFGIHFTYEDWANQMGDDSFYKPTAGFNLQFMSKNLWSTKPFGGYLGADIGFQFYDKGPRTNVALDHVNADSAYTHLGKWALTTLMRGHLEYGAFRLKPYLNFFIGPRFIITNQHVERYMKRSDEENFSNHSVHTGVSLAYGMGAGFRYRVTRVTSIDFRAEWMQGTRVKSVDLERSKFNGLDATYAMKRVTFKPDMLQWKLGVLFEIEPESETENDFRPYHPHQNTKRDSTNPCPCMGDTSSSKQEEWHWWQPMFEPSFNPPSQSGRGGKGSGRGKTPMPSIKPGSSQKPKIKS